MLEGFRWRRFRINAGAAKHDDTGYQKLNISAGQAIGVQEAALKLLSRRLNPIVLER